MSDPLRVSVAVEGPTDVDVLRAILPQILQREVIISRLQPTEESVALSQGGPAGFGWRGLLRWCDEVKRSGGVHSLDMLANTDLIVVHLDGDVARDPEINLRRPCPPASDTADGLRSLLAARLGIDGAEPRVVFMIPMEATEAWLLAMFREPAQANECSPDPASSFKGGKPKLLEADGKKKTAAYRRALAELPWKWESARRLSQAERFERDLHAGLSSPSRAQGDAS